MNIIKYGKGYKPEIVICEHCKSKIGYFDRDLETKNQSIFSCDKDVICEIEHIGFNCPVCNTWINIFKEYIC